MARDFLFTALLTLLPISELRGALPYALSSGISLWWAYPYTVILNALIGPLVYLFLNSINRIFLHMRWYRKLFDHVILRARHRVSAKVERFGYLGITLFVAIPLPITGAYTGTLGAWVLGLEQRKTYLAVLLGVSISAVIVSSVWLLGISALDFFTKTKVL